MSSLQISVIIPAYNAAETLDGCLAALASQTAPRETYEIIVVDDGSVDGTRARVEAHSGVRLLTQDHAGPAAARNLGAQHASGEILLFTDADCEPAPDWIEQMMGPFRRDAADGEVAGVKGAYRTRQRELVARFVQVEYNDRYDRMARATPIDFVDTYAAGYRREVFLASGGFEAGFPTASVEDQEFSFRLSEQGYKLVFVPEAHVCHRGHPRNVWDYCRKKFKIGYWKVQVVRQHPRKLLRDSHTPQVLKVQIILVGFGALSALASLLRASLRWTACLFAGAFLLTTVPFVVRAWRQDLPVALISPLLLLLRALALGAGFAAGLLAQIAVCAWRGDNHG